MIVLMFDWFTLLRHILGQLRFSVIFDAYSWKQIAISNVNKYFVTTTLLKRLFGLNNLM